MRNLFAIFRISCFLLIPGCGFVSAEKLGGMDMVQAASWWAFQPLPPADQDPNSKTIDAFIDQGLRAQGLIPNQRADRRTLLRRLSYDLTGLPPTAEEVDAFFADGRPDAFMRQVDRLLASPEYGVQWGRHWLDLVRYADTAGENTDRPVSHAWRYRNWVFDAFNQDLPYDRFVQLQLAGDLISAGTSDAAEGVVATGYLAIARRFGHDIDQDIHLMYEDVIDNLGKTFLGLTVSCARCHDHKYDPITAEDYYALAGIFNSSRFSYSGCEKNGAPRDMVPLMSKAELDALLQPWQARQTAMDAAKKQVNEKTDAGKRLARELAEKDTHALAQANVAEGLSVPFKIEPFTVRKGEAITLKILPNGNHGADSTLVEWSITQSDGTGSWNLANLIDRFTQSNPQAVAGVDTWYFHEATEGPALFNTVAEALDGRSELKKWSTEDLPSVFVNTAKEDVKVWTLLPARTVFVHPGPNRPVGITWVSPVDGLVSMSGRVADAHPSGGDGVSFQLDHVAAPDYGSALADLRAGTQHFVDSNEPRPEIPVAYAVVEAEVKNSRLQLRGEPETLGDEIPRRWLTIFGGARVEAEQGSGRRPLGEWIVSHPLAARVMVNRIWQGHMGEGLVRTPNDFGARGELPTHPELLDWLAAQFVASGYSIKTLHRLILGTDTYQRRAACTPAQLEMDAGNHWLARYPLRRLSAEELRDSLLFVSGALDRSPALAHPFPPENEWRYTQHNPFIAVYDSNKRSAYLMVQRQQKHPFLTLFDGADPNASTPGRPSTTVPTQALYFINDPFFHEQAGRLSERLIQRSADDVERLRIACRILYQREASHLELQQSKRFLASYPGAARDKWAAYVRVLMASNEFIHLD
ncbi:MAG: hypothetical protein ACI9TH_001924 [Kiritimatiellia bacterium]|jgi:hypothetical protein